MQRSCLNKIVWSCLGLCAVYPLQGLAVPWPLDVVNQTHGIWHSYGQYAESGPDIHLHEGIDLKTAAGTKVKAVTKGTVVNIDTSSADEYFHYVTIADDASNKEGWGYVHVKAKAGLSVGDVVNVGDEIGTITTTAGATSHLHFERNNDDNGGWPNVVGGGTEHLADDPLLHLNPATDGTAPSIDAGFKYRRAADEGNDPTPKYFTDKDLNGVQVVGSRAKAGESGDIDVVVSAYDKFGAYADKLSVQSIKFHSLGRLGDNTPFTQELVDFSGEFLDDADNFKQFRDSAYAQTVYENDKVADSADEGPFWYIVSNQDEDHKLEKTDAAWFWDTDGTKGQSWNDNKVDRAANNANSAFRDDFYDVYINVRDEANNVTARKEMMLLDNWLQQVGADKDLYFLGDDVLVQTGSQHQQNDGSLPIYIVREIIDGAMISDLDVIASTFSFTDSNGIIQTNFVWEASMTGDFFLLSDYDHDGIYHSLLDAFDPFRVVPEPPVVALMLVGLFLLARNRKYEGAKVKTQSCFKPVEGF